MAQENAKREGLKKQLHEEKQKISQLHLITTSEELKEELQNIDCEKISTPKKKNKKVALLKIQIKIRRKVLCQTVPIAFKINYKHRPITDIVKELCDFIDKTAFPTECAAFIKDPITLVGKQIRQKFKEEDSGALVWYHGTIIEYSDKEKTHCIIYDGDDEQYNYDLILDLLIGDLVIF